MTDPQLQAEVADLLYREARLLDEGEWQDWVDLFTDDCLYWVPTLRTMQSPDEGLSHMRDDKLLLKTRISRLGNPRVWSPEPWPTTCHLVSNVVVTAAQGEELSVQSSQIVIEYRKRDHGEQDQRTFGCLNSYTLVRVPEGLRIRRKRVDLINAEAALNAVAIPF